MNKIIHICYLPLNKSLANSFYINICEKYNIEVEWWNIEKLISNNISHNDGFKSLNELTINTLSELSNLLDEKNNEETVFNLLLLDDSRFYDVINLINSKKILKSTFYVGDFPKANFIKKIILSDKKKIFSLFFKKIFKKSKFRKAIKHDIVFFSGSSNLKKINEESVLFPINYIDYEHAKESAITKYAEKDYILFIDSYLPYHPDIKYLKKTISLDDEKYFSYVNNFLEKVEAKFGFEVVVALHPKSKYKHNPYSKRQVVENDTMLLVKNSSLVITHGSTAISWAIIYSKPVMLYLNDEALKFRGLTTVCYALSSYLRIPVFKNNSKIKMPDINRDIYEKYKYEYLTCKSIENKSAKVFFANKFKEMNKQDLIINAKRKRKIIC